jgi:hypothetical protein
MAKPPITITLGERTFTVQPLTVGQLEDLTVAIFAPDTGDPQKDARRGFERMIEALAAALSEDHPDVDAAAIRKMQATRHELVTAHAQVLELSEIATVPIPFDEVQKALFEDEAEDPKKPVTRERLILAYATALRRRSAPAPGEPEAGTASTSSG